MEGRVVQSLISAVATLFAILTYGNTPQSFSGNNRTESLMGLFKISHEEIVQIPGNWCSPRMAACTSLRGLRPALGANRLELGNASCPQGKEREAEHASHSRR